MKVSIIIPVYNLEPYIDDCIKSILAQSYTNYEAIFIDDGSTDNSKEIISSYITNDSRIIIKSIANSGVTHARLQGVKISTGNYIVFLDGDDILYPTALEKLLLPFQYSTIDITVSGYSYIDSNSKKICDCKYTPSTLTSKQYMSFIFNDGNHATPWGRMFKRSIIKDESLSTNRNIDVREDALMNLMIAREIKHVKIIDDITYGYRVRENSAITIKKELRYFLDYYYHVKKIITDNKINDCDVLKMADQYCLKICIHSLMADLKDGKWSNELASELLGLIKASKIDLTWKEKLKIKLFRITRLMLHK